MSGKLKLDESAFADISRFAVQRPLIFKDPVRHRQLIEEADRIIDEGRHREASAYYHAQSYLAD